MMKVGLKKGAIALLSAATVLLSISTALFYAAYVSAMDGYVQVSLEAAEYMLEVDKDFTDGHNEELKARIDATLDWYLIRVHGLGQNPDLVSSQNSQFERVLKKARGAGYDLSGEELAGKRGKYYDYDLAP